MGNVKHRLREKVLAWVLAIAVAVSMIPMSTVESFAADATPNYTTAVKSTAELKSRLDALVTKYNDKTWSYYYYGSECKGFATYIFNDLFHNTYIGAYYKADPYYIPNPNGAKLIGQSTSLTEASAKSILSAAKPGDFIQMVRRESKGPHSEIVYSIDSTGINIFDCNTDKKCGVKKYHQTWEKFSEKNLKVSLYRATNYPADEVNPISAAPTITSSKSTYTPSESVTVSWNSPANATSYWIDAYDPSGDHFLSVSANNFKSYNFGKLTEEGKYVVYVTAWNSVSKKVGNYSFYVKPPAPVTAPVTFKTTKTSYVVNDNVTISWGTAPNATNYWINVYNPSGSSFISKAVSGNSSIDLGKLTTPGKYTAFVSAWNSTSKEIGRFDFNVSNPTGNRYISDGDYHILLFKKDKTVAVKDDSTDDGANIQLGTFDNGAEDVYSIKHVNNGYYSIINKRNGKALTVDSKLETADSSYNVYQSEWTGADNQQWTVNTTQAGGFGIVNKKTAMYLTCKENLDAEGTNVQVANGHNWDGQVWSLEAYGADVGQTVSDGTYNIVSALETEGKLNPMYGYTDNGTNINLAVKESAEQRLFDVEYLGDGYYRIMNPYSGKSLHVEGARIYPVANLILYDWDGDKGWQKWILKDAGDGYFYIISKDTGMCLEVADESGANAANIQLNILKKTAAQKFRFAQAISADDISVEDKNIVYDGTPKTPALDVRVDGKELAEGTDYVVEYANNVDAGTATVTVKGIGAYCESVEKTFEIEKAERIIDCSIESGRIKRGNTQKINVECDGDVTYSSADESIATVDEDGVITANEPGSTFVVVYAPEDQNYRSATKTIAVKVIENLTEIDECDISIDGKNLVYDGTEKVPYISVKYGDEVLAEGTDYTLSYRNNVKAGTGEVTVTGKGRFIESVDRTFEISKAVPTYEVPTGLTALCGMTLSDVKLPDGFAWEDGSTVLESAGKKIYSASYEPSDAADYVTVSGIEVEVDVQATEATGISLDRTEEAINCTSEGFTLVPDVECSEGAAYAINWSSSNEKVAAVDNNGRVTPAGEGTVVITALISSDVYAECIVTVSHEWNTEKTIDKNATCTEDGQESIHCALCGSIKSGSETVIHAKGHSFGEWYKDKKPTCTEKGIEKRECAVCDAVETRDIDALGHNYSNVEFEATCTEEGYIFHKCPRCGDSYREETEKAKGHDYSEWRVISNADCENTGTKMRKCLICGDIEYKSIPETGHSFGNEYIVMTEPTCTENGMKCKKCSVCGNCDEYVVIPATGHDFSDISNLLEATCTTPGIRMLTCVDCSVKQYELIESEGHHEVYVPEKKATCTSSGMTEGCICDKCNEVIVTQQYISSMGHCWNDGVVKPATASADGNIRYECLECKKERMESIPYVKSFSLSTTTYTYNASAKKPGVTVEDRNGKKLVNGVDYKVKYADGRKNVGKYSVTVTGIGNYDFTKKLYFRINPKGTSISKLTRYKKAFTVKWKKRSSQTTGYQIRYSTKSSMSSAKTVTVTKNSIVSKKISKLKAKKKYYVQVRTYKTVSGTRYYSNWSTKKAVTTK